MSTENVSEILKEKLLQIAEGVAFMFIDDDAAPLPDPAPGIEVKLTFTGPQLGAFWLALSNPDSNCLATGMLGRPLVENADANTAAPSEFLNILANWVLDALWGDRFPYRVDVPSVKTVSLESCVVWSIPVEQRAIVKTDAGCTLACGITWDDAAAS